MQMNKLVLAALCCLPALNLAAKTETLMLPGLTEGQEIYGILTTPDDMSAKPGIAIVSHGFNGTHASGANYVDMLTGKGYATYAFDFPGGSLWSRSGNNTMTMSIPDEKQVLENIVEYFRSRPDIDSSRLVLIGESQGGLVSALAAADLKEQISSLVLIYPALCIPDNWNAHYPNLSDIPEKTDLWGVSLSRRFFEEIHDMDPYRIIGAYKGPVLIVHGTADGVVPISYSERADKLYGNSELVILEGENHGFSPEGNKRANDRIREVIP